MGLIEEVDLNLTFTTLIRWEQTRNWCKFRNPVHCTSFKYIRCNVLVLLTIPALSTVACSLKSMWTISLWPRRLAQTKGVVPYWNENILFFFISHYHKHSLWDCVIVSLPIRLVWNYVFNAGWRRLTILDYLISCIDFGSIVQQHAHYFCVASSCRPCQTGHMMLKYLTH